MSWKSLKFYKEDFEMEYKYRTLMDYKARILVILLGAVLGFIYLEYFFWVKGYEVPLREMIYPLLILSCITYYLIFHFKQDELRGRFDEEGFFITNSEDSKSNIIEMPKISEAKNVDEV